MFELIARDRVAVPFTGAAAGTGPLTWGQKAILQDMQASGGQFSMGGWLDLPEGSTVQDATTLLTGLLSRHAALRVRLGTDSAGRPRQEVAGSGQAGLDILTMPEHASRTDVAEYAAGLMDSWPSERFDFQRDWPLRVAVLRHRGTCTHLAWVLSHLVADGGGHLLLLDDMLGCLKTGSFGSESRHPDILDVAASEQTPQLRQLSSRAMRHWEAQLGQLPPQTFAGPASQHGRPEPRYWQAKFSSPATQLATLAIAGRTGTDSSRVTLAVIATAIGRAIGAPRLTIKVMVNNRFRPGLAGVIAPIAQNSLVSFDLADATIDELVTRTRGAALTAGMRAYYDPDELAGLSARLDAERGYQARVTCRVNDQRAMIPRTEAEAGDVEADDVEPRQVREKLAETTLTWLGPRSHMHEQANILIENRPDVVSLHMMWDRWSVTDRQVEEMLRGVEQVAVEAAFDPAARASR
jgi:hypothetical protein